MEGFRTIRGFEMVLPTHANPNTAKSPPPRAHKGGGGGVTCSSDPNPRHWAGGNFRKLDFFQNPLPSPPGTGPGDCWGTMRGLGHPWGPPSGGHEAHVAQAPPKAPKVLIVVWVLGGHRAATRTPAPFQSFPLPGPPPPQCRGAWGLSPLLHCDSRAFLWPTVSDFPHNVPRLSWRCRAEGNGI